MRVPLLVVHDAKRVLAVGEQQFITKTCAGVFAMSLEEVAHAAKM
jgi:hypothetical protein